MKQKPEYILLSKYENGKYLSTSSEVLHLNNKVFREISYFVDAVCAYVFESTEPKAISIQLIGTEMNGNDVMEMHHLATNEPSYKIITYRATNIGTKIDFSVIMDISLRLGVKIPQNLPITKTLYLARIMSRSKSLTETADYLNKKGMLTKLGKEWSIQNLRQIMIKKFGKNYNNL